MVRFKFIGACKCKKVEPSKIEHLHGEQVALRNGISTATKDQTNKGTSDCKKLRKNLEISESRDDVVKPVKKLRSIRKVMEASDNQHFPRPLTRRPGKVGWVDNQSGHVMEESTDCSPAGTAHSIDRDCSKQGDVENVINRELNEEDKDEELIDPKVKMVEDSVKGSTKNLSDHGKLAVLEGVEKQVSGSTLHDTVSEQNATNQVELTSTHGMSTSAGASPTAVQPCAWNSPQQSNEGPDAALSSIATLKPSLALPFQKSSTVWSSLESMEIFAKFPQNPHFSPLAEHEEVKREELALQKMLKYAFLGDKISKLTIADLKNSMVINDILTCLKDLEECGFDVMQIKRPLDDLLNRERQIQFQNKFDEIKGRIRDCNLESEEAEKEISKITMKVKDLEKELMSAKERIEMKDQVIFVLRSEESVIRDEIHQVQLDFERTAASPFF
ncbi:PREDICTED: DUF724 domain-containing protein 6-like isoform X1 [Nicotiana attenuata]|uniref:DUF724 domain-containing protein 6-like isoform X1 n=1 Tax=Nicotiana attenuata TaxID=49451 RepID=UPI0009055852|nr:PREDICTED: DUF724 domain-containing protein 6-like isoform X1 [Nicotiana attenuata]